MIDKKPLVSIGIPTYNRAELLKRSIESALSQDYKNIEILISDNASTDKTQIVCQHYVQKDVRIKYVQHSTNRGPGENFSYVLLNATGQFFMWLGDDDWLDSNYVTRCVNQLINDETFSLVSGLAKYYKGDINCYDGSVFNLLSNLWWLRMISYYWQVADNGMFYGVMRTHQIRQVKMVNTMGGDWLLIANIVFMGKVKVFPDISVHRELGGASTNFKKIVESLGLPKIQGLFPATSIAYGAMLDIVKNSLTYQLKPFLIRAILGTTIFCVIIANSLFNKFKRLKVRFTRILGHF